MQGFSKCYSNPYLFHASSVPVHALFLHPVKPHRSMLSNSSEMCAKTALYVKLSGGERIYLTTN